MHLIILIGLQASGKSTFARASFADCITVSKDAMRNVRDKNRRQEALIRHAFDAGRSVVVDNTNPSPAVRAPLLALAREYGARIIGYYFISSIEDCLARNRHRAPPARVPDIALFTTRQQLSAPSFAEGFEEFYNVAIDDERMDFIVTEWDNG